jgi:hypothetical protein
MDVPPDFRDLLALLNEHDVAYAILGCRMKFRDVFKLLADFFHAHKVDYALIGAFALNAYGYMRATGDIDFIVRRKDQNKIIDHLESLGFETVHRSTGYSNHLHGLSGLGRIDFVYVTGRTADAVFADAREALVLGNQTLPVVKPEHLAALKVFAMKNDPSRRLREMADIAYIIRLPDVDLKEIRKYFEKYGQSGAFDEIIGKKGVERNA